MAQPEFRRAGFVIRQSALERGFRAVDLDRPAVVEGGHGVGRGDAVLQFAGEHLVIDDVVVAAVGAAAPRRAAEEIEDGLVVRLIRAIKHHAQPAAFVAEVAVRVVKAVLGHRATVGAAFRRAGRGVLGAEPSTISIGGNRCRRGTAEPAEQVGVVGALRDDHRRRAFRAAPVAADERVRLMERLHTFVGPDRDQPAEATAFDHVFHRGVERRVAQDKAQRHAAAEFAGAAVDRLAALERLRGGLL